MRNLELKVACDAATFEAVRKRAAALAPLARMRQRDTYYHAPHGRLKLREIATDDGTASAELIGYRRADIAGARWSAYHRAAIDVAEVAALKAALGSTLGERVVVEKVRIVGVTRRTRMHLDEVAGLGSFVELETVVGDNDAGDGADAELAEVARALGIDHLAPISGSYSDVAERTAPDEAAVGG